MVGIVKTMKVRQKSKSCRGEIPPLFSIVLANYNHGKFIRESINSILSQSCKDFELIVIDGGSTDESVNIIKEFSSALSWWVSEADTGQSNAFNKGFAKAKGEYFFWVNADDILLPNTLEYIKQIIVNDANTLWIVGNTVFFNEDGKIMKCAQGPKWNSYIVHNSSLNIYGPSSIFHHSLYTEVGGFNEKLHYAMDTDLWLRFKEKGFQYERLKQYIWGFRVHTNSKTSHAFRDNPNDEYREERSRISDKYQIKNSFFSKYIQRVYKLLNGNYLLSLVDSIIWNGRKIERFKSRYVDSVGRKKSTNRSRYYTR